MKHGGTIGEVGPSVFKSASSPRPSPPSAMEERETSTRVWALARLMTSRCIQFGSRDSPMKQYRCTQWNHRIGQANRLDTRKKPVITHSCGPEISQRVAH